MTVVDQFVHRFERGSSDRTLLLLHGTGGDENDLVPLGRDLAAGWNVLSPRGRVLEGGMPRFFRRLAPGVFDLEDLKLRAAELAEFVQESAERYQFDPAKLTALGYSNGANIAAAVMLLHPGVIRNGVLWRAMVPIRPETAPDLTGTSVLIRGGRLDGMIPPDESRELARLLEAAGAEVQLEWHPGGHELGAKDLEASRQWLASR